MIDIEFAEKIYFKEKTHATNTYTHNRTETPVIYGLNSYQFKIRKGRCLTLIPATQMSKENLVIIRMS